MPSDPSDQRRAMLGLAAILTVVAALVTVGVSLQRHEREPAAAAPPPTETPARTRATQATEAITTTTTTIATRTTSSIPSTTVPAVAPPSTLAVTAGTVTGSGVMLASGGVLASLGSATVGARVAAPDRPPLRVVEVSLVADPANYTGPCPTTIRFHGTIRVQGRGRVSHSFPRSDGARGPVETIEADSASPATVETYWMLGRQPANPFEGWQVLQIVAPQPMTSERAAFRITCVP
jgi:hypothetical protein